MNTPSVNSGITDTIGKWLGIGQKKGEQKSEAPAQPSMNNPRDMYYSDGINTPLEIAFLPFADLKSRGGIHQLSQMKDPDVQYKFQGEVSLKDNIENGEKIDYSMKSDKEGNVLVEGKYGETEFKEEYSPDGAFSAKLKHFVKDKATGEYVKDGDVAFTDIQPNELAGGCNLNGNIAGIPIEEKIEIGTRDYWCLSGHVREKFQTAHGQVGGLEINNDLDPKGSDRKKRKEERTGNVGQFPVSEDVIYNNNHTGCISQSRIGDFEMKMKTDILFNEPQPPQQEQGDCCKPDYCDS